MKKIKYIVFDHDGTLVDTTVIPRSLYPGMKDLLTELKANSVELFVWTARNRPSTIEILESLGIITEFKELACGIENAPKPSPEGIISMLPGVDPAEVVVIGDSIGDMIGGSEFGAHSIGALWANGDAAGTDTYLKYGASACFVNIEECKNYLIKIIRGE